MKPPRFAYHAPATLDDCLRLLDELGEDAVLLAGGQSLIPLMRFRLAQPQNVISIGRIGGSLSSIERTDSGIAIGAAVTFNAVQRSAEVDSACPALGKAIDLVAHPAVRSRGTLCGNLCQADPASELPALALIMDARFHLAALNGRRVIKAQEFFEGPYTTARRSNEILAAVEFPRRPSAERVAVQEITRVRGGFPLAGIALAVRRGDGPGLQSAAISCFGLHPVQIRLPEAEAVLQEQGCTSHGIDAAAEAMNRAIEPHSDPFASAAYRHSVARTLLRRAMDEVCSVPDQR